MKTSQQVVIAVCVAFLLGCAADGGSTATRESPKKAEQSTRGSGKFAGLTVGMKRNQVNRLIGSGSETTYYSSGKGYIPFYYGDDRQKANVWYRGVGCLVFNTGQEFGNDGGGELSEIINDASGKCH